MTESLELWLDARRLHGAPSTDSRGTASGGEGIGVWVDASGLRRDARQADPARRPRLVHPGAVWFDGRDDALAVQGLGEVLGECTVVVAAVPLSNAGGFRAFAAFHQAGRNDYLTGLTLDMGPLPSLALDFVNVEGSGFVGAENLAPGGSLPFGELRILTATYRGGPGGVRLFLDGAAAGSRDRSEGALCMDDVRVGARFYSNTEVPPSDTGFLEGCIAEVLVYGRALPDGERGEVEAYLARKHAGLARAVRALARRTRGKPLVSVSSPPALQVLVPGFTVRELPLDLPNVNNVRYRDDGRLVALAYDGTVHLLADADGDGLEERADLFWDRPGILAPIGMALTPPGYRHGRGLFLSCKGRVVLVVDTDGDDRGDREIVVAEGWPPIQHNVDALGVAVDPEGNVYFGLGTPDYTNAYLVDAAGEAHFDLSGERGTILKVSADFRRRETVCTGIRFPVALAFNRRGDLFATDQEGATWLANGNPLDELLHVQPGRHYGFPPRHPRHLPGVLDEPSVAEYGPQHQSACGLAFDEPLARGEHFGPAAWRGDALVCGYSRGKIFRTRLVRSAAGYVGQTSLFACLTPRGELVVAVHSGGPDWGTGPSGRGKLYQVAYSDREAPQPLFAAAASPSEVRIAFDRPLDLSGLRQLAKRIEITAGRHVRPGDRFEVLRPGYQVVMDQLAVPRLDVAVRGASVSSDRRTLILATDPLVEPLSCAVTIRGLRREAGPDSESADLRQEPDLELSYDLSGVLATWSTPDGEGVWSGWLPHLDLDVARELTKESAEHDRLWAAMEAAGTLTLRAQLDLFGLLRPAVQPGANLDCPLPPEEVTLAFHSAARVELRAQAPAQSLAEPEEPSSARLRLTPSEGELAPIEVVLTHAGGEASAALSYSTNEDPRPRALPLSRILVPWAAPRADGLKDVRRAVPPELSGGDWLRGRRVFLSGEAQCARCHAVDGTGGAIGPDLSNLRHRDYASVLRDVVQPSLAINPDFVTYVVALQDGTSLTGTVRTQGEELRVGGSQGEEVVVARGEVEELIPQSTSIMPDGLAALIGPERLRDVLTFLLLPPPEELSPAPLSRGDAPPGRTRAEVEAVLGGAGAPAAQGPRPLHVVLVAGEKDHGPDEHDYPSWQRRWECLLGLADGVRVSTASDWPSAADLASADLLVWYCANAAWSAAKAKDLDSFLARGGGMVFLHFAVNGQDAPEELAQRIGLAWQGGRSRYRHGPLDLELASPSGHPICRGFRTLHLVDESYWDLVGDARRVQVLATAVEEGEPRPLAWTRQVGPGRVFVSIPGHYAWTFDDPLFRLLVLRGMAWCAGESVDRLESLATVGARWQGER